MLTYLWTWRCDVTSNILRINAAYFFLTAFWLNSSCDCFDQTTWPTPVPLHPAFSSAYSQAFKLHNKQVADKASRTALPWVGLLQPVNVTVFTSTETWVTPLHSQTDLSLRTERGFLKDFALVTNADGKMRILRNNIIHRYVKRSSISLALYLIVFCCVVILFCYKWSFSVLLLF